MNRNLLKNLMATALILFVSVSTFAEVKLPHIIGNNMVIQANKPVAIWGQAAAGEEVTVRFANQVKKTTTDHSGLWRVVLDPIKTSSKPATMTISGANTIKLDNILVGEVWVCSGQSNMEFPLAKGLSWRTGVNDWEKEVSQA
ncbi:MAG: sialate O-acetylesterase, partial [Bacteroidota bacterium]|nr:sialate O-acetylesterase [Bacteroidota bacterium]